MGIIAKEEAIKLAKEKGYSYIARDLDCRWYG